MSIDENFERWGLGFSGCDGGDPGTPDQPAIWVCGIEWGGGHDAEGLISDITSEYQEPPIGYESWNENISYIFNWQVMKLLCSINGGVVSDYKKFAEEAKPFVSGCNGYFKMNLYPISFKDTDHVWWKGEFSAITGFKDKNEYLQWCKEKRFPIVRNWVSEFKPKLIICLGKTYANDFSSAFYDSDKQLNHESIDEKDLLWGVNKNGSLIVTIPFMVNRNGLTKNVSIQKFGERIAELLTSQAV